MIKDQCNNCKKNLSSACTHSIVYNGTPCPDYVKKLDLTKPNETPTPNTSSNYTPGNNQSNNTQAKPVNSGFSFSSLFSFKGRIRRTAYWLTNFGLSLLLLPANLAGDDMSEGLAIYTLLVFIPIIWMSLANSVKRFHDLGKSGWYAALLFVPIANFIFGIYAAFFKGEECDNQYGPNPY